MTLRLAEDSVPVAELISNAQVQGIVVEMVNVDTGVILTTVTNGSTASSCKRRFIRDMVCAARIVHRGFLQNVNCELRFRALTPST